MKRSVTLVTLMLSISPKRLGSVWSCKQCSAVVEVAVPYGHRVAIASLGSSVVADGCPRRR